jgi:hypothetical protein
MDAGPLRITKMYVIGHIEPARSTTLPSWMCCRLQVQWGLARARRDRASPWASFATVRNTTERATITAAPMTQVSNDGMTIVVAFLPRSGPCFQHQIERGGGGAPHARESSAHYHFPQSCFTALSAESRTDFLR